MMKFFRKYNKQLLAIFMALLMIVFIGGSALQNLLQPDVNRKIATSKFGDLMFKDQEHARAATALLEATGISWQYPGGARKPIEVVDWILLQREAAALKATISPVAARSSAIGEQLADRIERVARLRRIRPQVVYDAVAQLMTVEQAAGGAIGITTASDAELSVAARNALETVKADAVVLPARAFVDANQVFTREEMESQLTKYRERVRGPGLNFGYHQGTALKVQYVQINRDAIAANTVIPDVEVKARRFYDEKKERDPRFRRAADEPAPPDPFRDGELPGPPLPAPPYKSWEAARDIAVDALKKQQADDTAGRIADWLLRYSNEAWADAQRAKSGYRPAPPDAARLDYYTQLLERLPVALNFAGAISVGSTNFFTEKQAEAMKPISIAMFRPDQGMAKSFKDLVFRSEPVIPQIPAGEGGNPADYLAVWQTSQYPLADAGSGDIFVFRIIDSKPAHPAESVDEVHDQIVEDLRMIKGLETSRIHAASLVSAVESGAMLKEAFEEDLDLVELKDEHSEAGYFEPVPFTRVPRGQAARGRPTAGMFVPNGVGTLPNDVIDGIFSLESANSKIRSFELQDRASILVAVWQATNPAPEDEFNSMKRTLVTDIARERRAAALGDWLDPEKIRARTQFLLATQ